MVLPYTYDNIAHTGNHRRGARKKMTSAVNAFQKYHNTHRSSEEKKNRMGNAAPHLSKIHSQNKCARATETDRRTRNKKQRKNNTNIDSKREESIYGIFESNGVSRLGV